jgi:hypothetical protein
MIITLADPETLRITNMADAYDWLAALPGSAYDKASRSLSVRLCNLRRIVAAYPQAQLADRDAVIAARVAQWGRWVEAMNDSGIHFGYLPDGRTVSCTGSHVSPCFQAWTAEHGPQIGPWLGEQQPPATMPVAAVTVEPTHGDRLILTGVKNAKKAEAKRAAIVKRKWRKVGA